MVPCRYMGCWRINWKWDVLLVRTIRLSAVTMTIAKTHLRVLFLYQRGYLCGGSDAPLTACALPIAYLLRSWEKDKPCDLSDMRAPVRYLYMRCIDRMLPQSKKGLLVIRPGVTAMPMGYSIMEN